MALLINATGCDFLLLHQASKYNQTKDVNDIKDNELVLMEPMMDAGMDIKKEMSINNSVILIYDQSPLADEKMIKQIQTITAAMKGDSAQCIVPEYVAKAYANHIKDLWYIDTDSAFTFKNHTVYTRLVRAS